MKAALLAFSFVFVFFTKPSLITGTSETVLDVDGKRVRVGASYYILPFVRGMGGGLTLSSRNNTCPLNVVQEDFETERGEPVIFSPAVEHKGYVSTETDINIQNSDVQSICLESNVWRLRKELSGVWFISGDGVKGNPSADTLVNWFKIWKTKDKGVYKLAFCPTVCKQCKTICDELAIYRGEGRKRHLALGDKLQSFPVIFKRASPRNLVSPE